MRLAVAAADMTIGKMTVMTVHAMATSTATMVARTTIDCNGHGNDGLCACDGDGVNDGDENVIGGPDDQAGGCAVSLVIVMVLVMIMVKFVMERMMMVQEQVHY